MQSGVNPHGNQSPASPRLPVNGGSLNSSEHSFSRARSGTRECHSRRKGVPCSTIRPLTFQNRGSNSWAKSSNEPRAGE